MENETMMITDEELENCVGGIGIAHKSMVKSYLRTIRNVKEATSERDKKIFEILAAKASRLGTGADDSAIIYDILDLAALLTNPDQRATIIEKTKTLKTHL